MEFSSPATQRGSSASESLVIQPGSARSPAADAATDFARHLAESSKQRSDRRDDRPIERHERSAASGDKPGHKDGPAVREASREDRDRESKKAGAGESSSATPERAPAPDPQIDLSDETVGEDTTVAAEETAKADGNEQAPAEDETDTTVGDEAEGAAAAAVIPTTETAPAKTLQTSASSIAPVAIKGNGDAASQQAAAPAGKESLEGQPAPAAQSGEETPSAIDFGKTQSRTAAQAPSGAQASPANGTAEEQLAAAGAETAEMKPEKAEKGLGQEAAEKLAERKSGAGQTASQTNAATSPAAGQQAARATNLASQIARGTSTIANTGPSTGSDDMPVSAVQQSANAGGNAATVRIGTLPGQSQPTQLPANAIALQMARNLQKGINRFDIRLDPPEMGRIDVRMEVRKDGHVVAHMAVDRPETLDLLQRDARALQQALNNAGLQADSDSLNFSLRDQNDNSGGRDFAGSGNAAASDDADAEMPLTQIYNVNLAANGGVDIRI